MKTLVYYVIGCERDYSQLLDYSLQTLHASGYCGDIMVMCDEDYLPVIKHLPITYFHITKKNNTPMESSMRKIEIFDYEHIDKYDKVLFLDCDIVVTNSTDNVFNMITRDDVLYVVRNCYDINYYKYGNSFGCKDDPYDEETLKMFEEKQIYGFNAGQFGFRVSDTMRHHFMEVYKALKRFDPAIHFYEQSFINNYFNRKLAIDYSLEKYVHVNGVSHKTPIIVVLYHVCGANISYLDKLAIMKRMYNEILNNTYKIACYDTRDDIGDIIKLPINSHIAEIGVFRGEFSHILYTTYFPEKHYLIDPWDGDLVSGDKNGNNVTHIRGEDALKEVQALFANNSQVSILRKYSNKINNDCIPDGSLDLIYIDGDHSYKGAYEDLQLGWRLVKRGGWIAGHDYCMNMNKTNNNYDFGVKQAVEQFCREKGIQIYALLNDGCVSYVLRKSY
jgi:hypothetical protein